MALINLAGSTPEDPNVKKITLAGSTLVDGLNRQGYSGVEHDLFNTAPVALKTGHTAPFSPTKIELVCTGNTGVTATNEAQIGFGVTDDGTGATPCANLLPYRPATGLIAEGSRVVFDCIGLVEPVGVGQTLWMIVVNVPGAGTSQKVVTKVYADGGAVISDNAAFGTSNIDGTTDAGYPLMLNEAGRIVRSATEYNAITSGDVTGTGVNQRITLWTGTSTVSYDDTFRDDLTTNKKGFVLGNATLSGLTTLWGTTTTAGGPVIVPIRMTIAEDYTAAASNKVTLPLEVLGVGGPGSITFTSAAGSGTPTTLAALADGTIIGKIHCSGYQTASAANAFMDGPDIIFTASAAASAGSQPGYIDLVPQGASNYVRIRNKFRVPDITGASNTGYVLSIGDGTTGDVVAIPAPAGGGTLTDVFDNSPTSVDLTGVITSGQTMDIQDQDGSRLTIIEGGDTNIQAASGQSVFLGGADANGQVKVDGDGNSYVSPDGVSFARIGGTVWIQQDAVASDGTNLTTFLNQTIKKTWFAVDGDRAEIDLAFSFTGYSSTAGGTLTIGAFAITLGAIVTQSGFLNFHAIFVRRGATASLVCLTGAQSGFASVSFPAVAGAASVGQTDDFSADIPVTFTDTGTAGTMSLQFASCDVKPAP